MGVSGALDLGGVTPAALARPTSVDELCAIVRDADARGLKVMPVGGGTHLGIGYPPDRVDVALDMTGLAAVNEYEPDDLTISVQAGMRASALAKLLAARGQFLPLDASAPELATIGGMIAVGQAGPRRLGFGSLRDLLIGVRLVMADGTLVKSGGMVVKNVSGYDITRLAHGSLGSLGIILDANFKCLSAPAQQTLLIARGAALDAGVALFESALPFSGIAITDDAQAYVGCEGHRTDAARLRGEARRILQRLGIKSVEEVEGAALTGQRWGRISPASRGECALVLRIASTPSELAQLVGQVQDAVQRRNITAAWTADVGCGVLEIGVRPKSAQQSDESVAAHVSDFFEDVSQLSGSLRVIAGDPRIRSVLPVFGPDPPGLSLMRLLKRQFDPNSTLNAGRNAGRL